MYIEAGYLPASLMKDVKRAEFGEPDAIARVNQALDEYRASAGKGPGGTLSSSGTSAVELIADPSLRSLGREAAEHGEFAKFLEEWGIVGNMAPMTLDGRELQRKLGERFYLSHGVLRGIAKAADTATRKEKEMMTISEMLVGIYNDLLSKFLSKQYDTPLARGMLDKFFSQSAFLILQKLKSFDSPKRKRVPDQQKLARLEVFILDQVYSENARTIEGHFADLKKALLPHPRFMSLSKDEVGEIARYASLASDIMAASDAAHDIYLVRQGVEEDFDGTTFDSSTRVIAKAVQFSPDVADALRRARLIVEGARRLALKLPPSIEDGIGIRLAVIAICHSIRTGRNDIENLLKGMAKTFLAIHKSVKGKFGDLSLELALRMSLLSDSSKTAESFAHSTKVFRNVSDDLDSYALEDAQYNRVLKAAMGEIPLEYLEDLSDPESLRKAVIQASNTAVRMAKAIIEADVQSSQAAPPPAPKGKIAPRRPVGAAPSPKAASAPPPSKTAPRVPRPTAASAKAPPPSRPAAPTPGTRLPRPKAAAPIGGGMSSSELPEFDLRRNLANRFNWGSSFLDTATKWLMEPGDEMKRRAHLTSLFNVSMVRLKSELIAVPAAYAMIEAQIMAKPDVYLGSLAAIPEDDHLEGQRIVEDISGELTADIMSSASSHAGAMSIFIAAHLSDRMGLRDAIRASLVLAPWIVDDTDLARVDKNYKAVMRYFSGSSLKDVASHASASVRLEGTEAQALESTRSFSKLITILRMQENLKDLEPGRAIDLFNIALNSTFEFVMASQSVRKIAKTYVNSVEEFSQAGAGDQAEELALLVAASSEPDKAQDFFARAYKRTTDYYEGLLLRKDVSVRLATAVTAAIAEHADLMKHDPVFIAGSYAVSHLETYVEIQKALAEAGIEKEESIGIALKLVRVTNPDLRSLMVEKVIAGKWNGGGNGGGTGGPGNSTAPAGSGGSQSTPQPPSQGAQQADTAFAGIIMASPVSAPEEDQLGISEAMLAGGLQLPGTVASVAGSNAFIFGARIAMAAHPLA